MPYINVGDTSSPPLVCDACRTSWDEQQPFAYCREKQALVVRRRLGRWETFRGVSCEQAEEILAETLHPEPARRDIA